MTIEIKELVIRAVVTDDREQPARDDEREAELVETCVNEVLRVLRRSRER